MKVIAKGSGGVYIVEMNEAEIAQAAGYSSQWDGGWKQHRSGNDSLIGMRIDVCAAYNWHTKVERHIAEARSSSATLKTLAGMLDGALPDIVIPITDEGSGP